MMRKFFYILAGLAGSLAAVVGFTGCRVGGPFRGPGYDRDVGVTLPGVGETVIVGVTHAKIEGPERPTFREHTRRVLDSLPSHDGFVGHAARTMIFGNEVWTMTVWRDEAALDAFVAARMHSTARRAGLPAVTSAQFLRFELPTRDVPPTWDSVLERLKEVEPVEYR